MRIDAAVKVTRPRSRNVSEELPQLLKDLLRPYGKAEELLRMLFCADIIKHDLDLCIDMFGACIIQDLYGLLVSSCLIDPDCVHNLYHNRVYV